MQTNAAERLPVEFLPLPTTREERGREIAKQGGIRRLGARFVVPSQAGGATTYLVDVADDECTCPDYEVRRARCKHIEGVLFWLVWEAGVNAPAVTTAPRKRKTYPQKWPTYNAAQTTEKARVELLLKSLCDLIEEPPPKPQGGRPSRPLRDKIFAVVMQTYTGMSGRRATTEIKDCAERGHIATAPSYNTLFRCLEDEATTAVLTMLIEACADPVVDIENEAGSHFAVDSTGFSTVFYDRWFDQKHGKLKARHAWVKLHCMAGTATHIVTSVKVSGRADGPVLPELVQNTAKRFPVRRCSADKAYLSRKNLKVLDDVGAVPFIPFKTTSQGMTSKSPHWRRMWAHFTLKTEDFLRRYHMRSNVESTIGMIKRLFGGSVRSRLPTARLNEVLCKVLCHNLVCFVHAIVEYGIEVDFGKPALAPSPQPMLTVVP